MAKEKAKVKDGDLKPQVYKDPRPAEYFDQFHATARRGPNLMWDVVRMVITPICLLSSARARSASRTCR